MLSGKDLKRAGRCFRSEVHPSRDTVEPALPGHRYRPLQGGDAVGGAGVGQLLGLA
jgi:hypothetical protein